MKKLIPVSIACAFAVGSACALADDMLKQSELNHDIAVGNPNAPGRGEAISRSAQQPKLPLSARFGDADAHEKALDLAIAAGNPNAPARGQAIAASAMTSAASQPLRQPSVVREQELDAMISAGNPNAPARGASIAASGRVANG